MSNQWGGRTVDQTCRCITPQGRTPSTQTFSSLSVFLYIPLQHCYYVSLLNNIKGPPHSPSLRGLQHCQYIPLWASWEPYTPPFPHTPSFNSAFHISMIKVAMEYYLPVCCLPTYKIFLYFNLGNIMVWWQYRLALTPPFSGCFQWWHWQNSLMILSLTPSPTPLPVLMENTKLIQGFRH